MLKKNNKAMLANLVGGFVTILIGISLIGPIAQETNNLIDCQYQDVINNSNIDTDSPIGSTNSFGGGGSTHFGGYDGKVKHNSFVDALASTSLVKTDKSVLNPDCVPITGAAASLLKIVPGFFSLAVLAGGIITMYLGLRNSGLIGDDLFKNKRIKKKKKK